MRYSLSIDRRNPTTLTQQVSALIRRGVSEGHFKDGAVLPSRAELSRKLGVSECVVRAGLDALVDEGLLVSRRGIGYVVACCRQRAASGRVLVIRLAHLDSYGFSVANRIFLSELTDAGYAVTCVYLGPRSSANLGAVRRALRLRPDFIVFRARLPARSPLVRLVARSGVPFLHSGLKNTSAAKFGKATEAFVAACRSRGVHSVGLVLFGRDGLIDAEGLLKDHGIWVETIETEADRAVTLEEIQRAGMLAMRKRLRLGTPLPDVLLFCDDYLTLGALPVLLEAGVRIPEDVSLVTLSNRGFGPVFTKSLARIEYDAAANATAFAKGVVKWLRTGVFAADASVPAVYQPGETFPGRRGGGK